MANWWSTTASGIVSGVVSGVVAAALVAVGVGVFASKISDVTLKANPDCSTPRGLKPVGKEGVDATGDFLKPNGTATDYYGPRKVLDNYGGSIWLPPQTADEQNRVPLFTTGKNVLTLTLKPPRDVRLLCVVNGLANSYHSYQNWGRVRTLTVWGKEQADSQTAVLASLGADSFPNAQVAARQLGLTDQVNIRLDDAYTGLIIQTGNPNECRDNATVLALLNEGCILKPNPLAGLSEVYLYEPTPD